MRIIMATDNKYDDIKREVSALDKKITKIEKLQIKEDMTLDAIDKRLDEHDKEEAIKKIDRKEEVRARKSNFVTIFIFLLSSFFVLGVWLNKTAHQTDLRLQSIENALGVAK